MTPVTRVVVRLALVVAVLAAGLAAASPAQADRAFAVRYSTNDTGSIKGIANTNMTCPSSASGCSTAQGQSPTSSSNNYYNNNYDMTYVDVDSDSATFNSSTANQSLPAGSTILFAGLYWGGDWSTGSSAAPSSSDRNKVKLKLPGSSSYTNITASTLDDSTLNVGRYQAFADVTGLIQALPNAGNGTYAVANIQAGKGSDHYAGWTLIVAYRNTSESAKNMSIFDGLVTIRPSDPPTTIPFSGFLTPPSGAVNPQVGFVTWEGDHGLVGDSASLNGNTLSDAQHPATNFFNSRISHNGTLYTDRNPSYANTLGIDAAWTTPPSGTVGNSQTSATLRVTTSGDQYLPGVITFQTEIFAPKIDQTKSVTDDNGGDVRQGDVLTYKIYGKNNGLDGTSNFVLRDPIPPNTTYVPGSISITKNTNASTGTKTDASSDDIAEFDSVNSRIVARLGEGASTSVGGNVKPASEYEVTFKVKVNGPAVNPVASGTVLTNTATSSFNSQGTGTPLTAVSTATATVTAAPNLKITKVRSGAAFSAGGTSAYTLTVNNHGDGPTSGTVTVSDPIPAGLTVTAINAPGWTCNSVPASSISCSRSDALAAGASYPNIVLTVAIDSGVTGEVENTSTVSGGGDSDLTDNTSSSTNPVSNIADLALTKTASKEQVVIGETFTYALTVTNNGPSKATSVAITDPLPAGLSFVSATPAPGCVIQPITGTLGCAVGTLNSGASHTVTVTVHVDGSAQGTLHNEATVGAQQTDPNPNNNTGSDDVEVLGADLKVTKTKKSPASVFTGNTVVYEVKVKNQGPSDATGVVLTDSLPAGLTNVTTNQGSCTVAEPTVSCVVGSLANGATWTVEVSGKVTVGTTELTNYASATGNEVDPDLSNNQAEVNTPVGKAADLSIVKTGSPAQVLPGGNLVYTFNVSNAGPDQATGVTVADTLPAGLTYLSGDAGCSAAGQLVTCNLSPIASGASRQVSITVSVAGNASGTIHNVAGVTGNENDPDTSNNEDPEDTIVKKVADLKVTKTKKSPANVFTGNTVTYEVKVENLGTSAATGVVLTDDLPAGLTGVTTNKPGTCTVSSSTVTCAVGGLAVGGSFTVEVSGTVVPGTSQLVNKASAAGNEHDPNLNNNESTVTTPVSPVADLKIEKLASVSQIEPGVEFTYTFKVTNNGPDNVTGVTVSDTLPAGLTYVDGAPGCSAAGQVVTCTINFLAAGGFGQTGISVVASDSAANPLSNTATVSSNVHDPNTNNNSSTISTPVIKEADVQIVKTVDNANPQAGDEITYTLTVKNNGPGKATGVVATDDLPAGVTFVSADAPCTESGGKVTCALGDLESGQEVALKIKVKVKSWTVTATSTDHGTDVQKVETQIDLNPGETRTIQATCPSGFFVSDGSVRIDHIDQGTGDWTAAQVSESRAVNNQTWQGTVTNTATGRVQAKIFAVCIRETTSPDTTVHALKVSDPVGKTVSLEPGHNVAVLECPDGTTAIQPGFITDSPGHLVYSQPEGNGWKFVFDTDADVSGDNVAFSIRCLSQALAENDGHSHDLSFTRIWTEQTIQPGQVHEVQLTCPDGSKGIVGGWDLDHGLVSLGNDPRPVTRAFKVYNPTDHPLTVRYSLLCLGDRVSGPITGDGSRDIDNTGKVTSTSNDSDLLNNESSVSVHATLAPVGDPVVDGNGKPPVNNQIAKTIVGKGVTYSASGVTFTLKCSGACGGTAKLTTLKKIKVGGKKFGKGTVLAAKQYFIGKAGTKKVSLKLTGAGRKILKKGKARKAALSISGGTRKVVKVGRP